MEWRLQVGKQRKRQHSSHQATHQSKKRQTQSRAVHLEISPEHLFEKGNFQDAVDVLKAYVVKHPTDDSKKRLLGSSFFHLKLYREAAEAWTNLQRKSHADIANIGLAYLNLEEWSQATAWLETSLQQGKSAYTYYLLALAYLQESLNRDLWEYTTDIHRLQCAVESLQQARILPDCPASAYLLLNDKLWRLACDVPVEGRAERERTQEKARRECYALMEEAFGHHPDDANIRLEFGEDLVYAGKYDAAILVLAPLVEAEPALDEYAPLKALAFSISASIELMLYEKTLQLLSLLPQNASSSGWVKYYQNDLPKLKGHLLLQQGQVDLALQCYQQEIHKEGYRDTFLGYFCCSWIWLQQGKLEESLHSVQEAMDIWFQEASPSDHLAMLDIEPVSITTVHVGECPTWAIQPVCEKLLEENVSPELKGQASYLLYCLLYKSKSGFYQEADVEEEEHVAASRLLLQAANWYPHPLISEDLVDVFLSRKDFRQAVEHHLRYYTYVCATHPDDFDEEYCTFAADAEMITTDEERKALHATAFQHLQRCRDASVLQAVFLVFFDSFWRSLLRDGHMYQELVDVTQLLMENSEEVNHLWFYHAWGLSKLGRDEESEQIYRQYLEYKPDDADTLHNLSILLEKKGLNQEALALSNKAVALAPNDENILRRNSRLKRAAEERDRSQLEHVHQEQDRLWSQLSTSQKWLLCLIMLYPSPHWSGLLPYIKHDEHQVRQLQEDWEKLLTVGICIQEEESLPYRVIPLLLPRVQVEGFRHWLVSEVARVQARKKKNLWLPEAADITDAQLPQLSPPQRDLLRQALMRKIDQVSLSGLEYLYLSFYRHIWKTLLIEWKMYAELVDLCEVFLSRLSTMSRREVWECAYYATHLSDSRYRNSAEKWYKSYLEQGEDAAAYHNLSIIYLERKQYQDALQVIEQALKLNPTTPGSLDQKARIEQARQKDEELRRQQEREQQRQKEQREQYLQELAQKIQMHLGEVDGFKLKILQAVKDAPHYSSKRTLAQQLRMEDWSFEGHWKKLVLWGMILEEEKRMATLHPQVLSYLEQGWPTPLASSMRTVVIHPGSGSLTKPVFGSKQEYKLYSVLLEIFHGQLVFPNMALQAIFPYQKMKEVLTKEEFSYYMVSHVDICITRTTSYFPLVAFEVDGPHHEQEERQRKDALKNAIFEKGGLGLIRLQIGYQPLSAKDVWEGVREKINHALYLWRSDPTRKGWVEDVETELGMSRFGEEESKVEDVLAAANEIHQEEE